MEGVEPSNEAPATRPEAECMTGGEPGSTAGSLPAPYLQHGHKGNVPGPNPIDPPSVRSEANLKSPWVGSFKAASLKSNAFFFIQATT